MDGRNIIVRNLIYDIFFRAFFCFGVSGEERVANLIALASIDFGVYQLLGFYFLFLLSILVVIHWKCPKQRISCRSIDKWIKMHVVGERMDNEAS